MAGSIKHLCQLVLVCRTAMETLALAVNEAGLAEFHYLDIVVKDGQVQRGRPFILGGRVLYYDDVVMRVPDGDYIFHLADVRVGQR